MIELVSHYRWYKWGPSAEWQIGMCRCEKTKNNPVIPDDLVFFTSFEAPTFYTVDTLPPGMIWGAVIPLPTTETVF